jgi:hypothetical protein
MLALGDTYTRVLVPGKVVSLPIQIWKWSIRSTYDAPFQITPCEKRRGVWKSMRHQMYPETSGPFDRQIVAISPSTGITELAEPPYDLNAPVGHSAPSHVLSRLGTTLVARAVSPTYPGRHLHCVTSTEPITVVLLLLGQATQTEEPAEVE